MSKKEKKKEIRIANRKARFEYEILERYLAGIALMGTEIKSLRDGKANIAESYGYVEGGELFVRNMNIQEYSHGNINNHDPLRIRKLLLQRRELNKIEKSVKDTGITLVPLVLFINEKGLAKVEIGVCRGKKDARQKTSAEGKVPEARNGPGQTMRPQALLNELK
jgi:SsrA-binding protein